MLLARRPTLWSRLKLTTRILIVLLALSTVSLVVSGFLALNEMYALGAHALETTASLGNRAIGNSTDALQDQAKSSLLQIAKDQAAISNALFEQVERQTDFMTSYASHLWSNPQSARTRRSYSTSERPDDAYGASVFVLAPGTSLDAVRDELALSSAVDDVFIPIHGTNPNLTWIYVGAESGLFRMYPWTHDMPASFDHRQRDWYRRAVTTRAIGWAGPYVDAAGTGLIVTCSKPVYRSDGTLIGVVGVDVTIQAMNQRIINTRIGQGGYAFLVGEAGKVIARPGLSAGDTRWDQTFQSENLLQSDDPEVRELGREMTTGGIGIRRLSFRGSEQYIAFSPLTTTNWSIGVALPVEEVVASAEATKGQLTNAMLETAETTTYRTIRTQSFYLAIFFLMVLVVAALAYALSRTITRPILTLASAAEAMEKGELGEAQIASLGRSEGADEVASLSRIFAKMAEQVKARETRLKRQVEELRIEIDHTKKARSVAEITETDYFQRLQKEAQRLRAAGTPAAQSGNDAGTGS